MGCYSLALSLRMQRQIHNKTRKEMIMKRILLPVLFLAAAGLAANGCDREDSAVGPKSEPAGIGRAVTKAP